MGLFKSAEEKELKRLEKEQKEQEKLYQKLEKYGLTDLTDERDIESVKNIINNLTGTGMIEFGSFLSGDEKGLLRVLVGYNQAVFEQNMIMIRMLNKIANK